MEYGGKLKARKENYRYLACGLPNATLKGVEVRRCGTCGDHEVVIPRILRRDSELSGERPRGRVRSTAIGEAGRGGGRGGASKERVRRGEIDVRVASGPPDVLGCTTRCRGRRQLGRHGFTRSAGTFRST